jgi:hypothetical protein
LVTSSSVERVGNCDEISVQKFETCVQAPNHHNETAEVIIVVEEHLGIVATDAHPNSLRTKEHADSGVVILGNRGNSSALSLSRHVGRLEEAHTFEHETGRHDRFAGHKSSLAEALTHVQCSVRLHCGHKGVDLTVTGVTSHLTEVAVLTQVHQEGRIANAAIETVLVGRSVALTQRFDHAEEVILNVELSLFGVGVGQSASGEVTREVVTALGIRRLTFGNSLKEFVDEHPITPTTIIVKKGEATDRLVEGCQITGVQQQTLGSNQSFPSNLESAGLSRIARISRTGVLTKSNLHFVLNDVTAIPSDRVVSKNREQPRVLQPSLRCMQDADGKVPRPESSENHYR